MSGNDQLRHRALLPLFYVRRVCILRAPVGSVAQLVEQEPLKLKVEGSTPSLPIFVRFGRFLMFFRKYDEF